jgi:hypothetical protein
MCPQNNWNVLGALSPLLIGSNLAQEVTVIIILPMCVLCHIKVTRVEFINAVEFFSNVLRTRTDRLALLRLIDQPVVSFIHSLKVVVLQVCTSIAGLFFGVLSSVERNERDL